eukprot:TRINITY_DN7179_c0_g1_i1.p1 TRINITY_DN7179_c0_g1~~TRINITY_DN7179_c0_g1_i1.p1  ORF type:complete len:577 (+),score=67.32 TRINITY_DN7179_c0_g1_i1:45-1775(+)
MASRPSIWKQLRLALSGSKDSEQSNAPRAGKWSLQRQPWQTLRNTHCKEAKNPLWPPHCGSPALPSQNDVDGDPTSGSDGAAEERTYPEPQVVSPLMEHFGCLKPLETPSRCKVRKRRPKGSTELSNSLVVPQRLEVTSSETRSSSSQGISAASSEKPTAASSPHSPPQQEEADLGPLVPTAPCVLEPSSPRENADLCLAVPPASPLNTGSASQGAKRRSTSEAPRLKLNTAKRTSSCPRFPDRLRPSEPLGLDLDELPVIGLVVAETTADGICRRAGMQDGDVLKMWNGIALCRSADLGTALAKTRIGSVVPVEIVRNGEPRVLELTFSGTQECPRPALGLRLNEKVVSQCLVVTACAPAGCCSRGGVMKGDILESWNGISLRSKADFRDHYRQLAQATLTFNRNGETITVELASMNSQRQIKQPQTAENTPVPQVPECRTLLERLRALRSRPEVNQVVAETETYTTETCSNSDTATSDSDSESESEDKKPTVLAKDRSTDCASGAPPEKAAKSELNAEKSLSSSDPREALERVRQKHLQLLQKLEKYDECNGSESGNETSSGSGSGSDSDSSED